MPKKMAKYSMELSSPELDLTKMRDRRPPNQDSSTGARVDRVQALLSRPASFWLLSLLLGFMLFGASAPSPLYGVYAAMLHFSPITLTEIYAVYALAAVTASLTTGRVSDHLGRRKVMILTLLVQMASMLTFINAHSVGALYVARLLQGLATGTAIGTVTAWLIDLQPPANPRLGSLMGSLALLGGLAAGALGSGLLVQFAPDPRQLVFWLLLIVYAIGLLSMFVTQDVVVHSPGWLKSMIPKIGVPPAARSLFVACTPSLVAVWALGGLYLSLGPNLAISLLRINSHIAGGLVIVALTGGGTLAAALTRNIEPRRLVIGGSLLLILGVGITLLAVALGSVFGLFAGSLVSGLGFGPAFTGIFRSFAALAPPEKRGALVSAINVVIQTSFSIPAVIAGISVVKVGLYRTTYAYGLVLIVLAIITTAAISRSRAS